MPEYSKATLLNGLKKRIMKIERRVPEKQITVAMVDNTSMIIYNKILATMITNFLCSDQESNNEKISLILKHNLTSSTMVNRWKRASDQTWRSNTIASGGLLPVSDSYVDDCI